MKSETARLGQLWGGSLSRSSSFSLMQRSIVISLATFRVVMVHVLFYCHLASWPRLVFFTFGPDLFYLLLAPTCFIFCWPRCFIVILARASHVLFYQLPGTLPSSVSFKHLGTRRERRHKELNKHDNQVQIRNQETKQNINQAKSFHSVNSETG